MAEQINLTTPETPPTNTFYRVKSLTLDWGALVISITLTGTNNELFTAGYEGEEARSLMTMLNKANLTTNSLHKRILNKLLADGKLAGTVSGTPT